MQPIRIVLVGPSAEYRSKVAQYLGWKYDFNRMRLIHGVNRVVSTLNGPGAGKKLHPTVKFKLYDSLYGIDNNFFVNYYTSRVVKTTKNVVVEDPRYIYEVQKLSDMGSVVVRVVPTEKLKAIRNMTDAHPGTVLLYELFPHTQRPYNPFYQILFDNQESMKLQVDNLIENLTKRVSDDYTIYAPNSWGVSDIGVEYETERTPNKTDNRRDQ